MIGPVKSALSSNAVTAIIAARRSDATFRKADSLLLVLALVVLAVMLVVPPARLRAAREPPLQGLLAASEHHQRVLAAGDSVAPAIPAGGDLVADAGRFVGPNHDTPTAADLERVTDAVAIPLVELGTDLVPDRRAGHDSDDRRHGPILVADAIGDGAADN